jgi:hypothetical protein
VIQLQTGVVVNGHELRAIVQAFRGTLDAEERYKPQDAMTAFNSFMQMLNDAGGAGIANLFRQRITLSYLWHGCKQMTAVRSAAQFSLMTAVDIQELLNAMHDGQFVEEAPLDVKDACAQCGGNAVRTHYETFDVLPECLVVFRNSIYPLRSAPETIIVSEAAYSLVAIAFNYDTMHYFCLPQRGGDWYTASDSKVLPITHPDVSAYTSSLKVTTIPYGFFYRRNQAEGTMEHMRSLPFYS